MTVFLLPSPSFWTKELVTSSLTLVTETQSSGHLLAEPPLASTRTETTETAPTSLPCEVESGE